MATTFVEYTGDGNATKQFTFPSYQESDVKVRVDGVLKTTSTHYNITGYTTTGGGNVVFTSGNIPSSPANIRIYRDTNVDTAKATYTAGSSVKAADLNNNHTQLLYRSQEEQIPNLIHSYDIDDAAIETSNIKNDSVTSDKIADDQINSEHYVDGSIDTQHIADAQITTAKIADSNVTTAKIADSNVTTAKIADTNVTTAKLADSSVTSAKIDDGTIATGDIGNSQITTSKIANSNVTTVKIADSNITTAKIADLNVTTAKIADNAITDDKIAGGSLDNRYYTETELDAGQLDNRYFTETELTNGALDGRYFTETEADARYFNISTGDTIKDGDTFPDNDTTIATTAAINDRIIDLVDDVGGFVPIANETSFPTANPDVNNGSGTLVSVKAISSTRTPSSGTVTIANGAGTGNTVTITGCGSTVLTAGFGIIVETTSTLHTYAFHRLVPKATEVTTVAGISSNVTTVATNIADINTVANDLNEATSEIDTVATNIANVNTVGNAIANVNTTAGDIANVNTVAGDIANVNTTAGSISNVNTVAGSISSVNNASSNINSINNFGDQYQVSSTAPSSDGGGNSLAVGDLYFDTSSNELRVYNGSTWQGGVTAGTGFAGTGSNTFTGNQTIQNTQPTIFLTDTNNNDDYSIQNQNGYFAVKDESDGQNRFVIHPDGTNVIGGNLDVGSGLDVTGNITVTGNVDGRDIAADGASLDSIEQGNIGTNVTNGNVKLTPNGTGAVEIKGAGGNDGTLQLNCSVNSHGVKIKAPPHSAAASYTLTLPNTDGNANQLLKSDGSGNLDWVNVTNANVDSSAAIAGTKISPDFGSQNVVTTGNLDTGVATLNGVRCTVVTDGSTNNGCFINAGDTGAGNRPDIILKGAGSAGLSQKAFEIFYNNGSNLVFDINYQGDVSARHADFSAGIDVTGLTTLTKTTSSVTESILEVKHGNGSQGIGLGYNTIFATGYNTDVDLRLESKGSGKIYLIDNVNAQAGLDVTGSITASSTVHCNGGLDTDGDVQFNSGTTNMNILFDASQQLLRFDDGVKATFGFSNDLQIYHDGTNSVISNNTGYFVVKAPSTEALYLQGSSVVGQPSGGGDIYFRGIKDGAFEAYYDNSKKFETTSSGATVTGTLTATSFIGDGSNLTGVSSAEIYGFNTDANGNLIVTTTNGGADNISGSTFDAFEDVVFAATGISFSLDSSGDLIATIS